MPVKRAKSKTVAVVRVCVHLEAGRKGATMPQGMAHGNTVDIWDRDDLFDEFDALDAQTEGVSVSFFATSTRATRTAQKHFAHSHSPSDERVLLAVY